MTVVLPTVMMLGLARARSADELCASCGLIYGRVRIVATRRPAAHFAGPRRIPWTHHRGTHHCTSGDRVEWLSQLGRRCASGGGAELTGDRTLIRQATVIQPGNSSCSTPAVLDVLLEGGKVAAIDPEPIDLAGDYLCCEAEGLLLTPGLIDLHTHGIHEFLYEAGPEHLHAAAKLLPAYGTTCVLPTLYTIMSRSTLGDLAQLAKALDTVDGAAMPGFHLEGPFLAISGAGASTVPGDLGLLEELLSAAQGRVLAMSVSPDAPEILPVIERLTEHGVTVFLTHTCATVDETIAAIDAGANHATHFYDVFPTPPETEPGVRPVGAVETLLADGRCTVDFICDGVHVHPMAIRAALAAKGWKGVVAITDSNIGAGLGDGVYPTPWGYSVQVTKTNATRVADSNHPLHGLLAGSSLTMDVAMHNLLDWLELPAEQLWAMATMNPADCVGLAKKGRIEVGADADLVLWEKSSRPLRAMQTWVGGHSVHHAGSPTCLKDKTA